MQLYKELCSINVTVSTTSQPFTVNLRIEGSPVPITVDGASTSVTDYKRSASSSWKQLVATNTYFGGSTAATYKIALYVTSTIAGDQDTFLADNFFVTPITGPDGQPLCST
ncbi:hypothetical protein EK21DRAFT_89522 [Setomelanomma holmii]|uniref:Uncharacterized protein n=1 Tax=Setomelanomma holmii TaxID=210430 RepID=A0A9P4H9M5_9PLEO|nr:hypothetical protein EK21DRAFT_89522 [Setomelanomma holmii]